MLEIIAHFSSLMQAGNIDGLFQFVIVIMLVILAISIICAFLVVLFIRWMEHNKVQHEEAVAKINAIASGK